MKVTTVFTLIAAFLLFLPVERGSARHDAVTLVPIGSKLSELDRHIPRGKGSTGEVSGTIKSDSKKAETVEAGTDYDTWKASRDDRDRFTGTITFHHSGSTSDDFNELKYKDGKLVAKDWGFLPG